MKKNKHHNEYNLFDGYEILKCESHDMCIQEIAEKINIIYVIMEKLEYLLRNNIKYLKINKNKYDVKNYINYCKKILYSKDIEMQKYVEDIKCFGDIRLILNNYIKNIKDKI